MKKTLLALLITATAALGAVALGGCTAQNGVNDEDNQNGGHVHNFATYTPDGNATCTQDGTKTAPCTYPGCTKTDTVTDTGSKLGHKFTEYVSDGNAACDTDGTKTAVCDRDGCTEKDTVTDTGSAGHKYAEGWSKDDDFHWHAATCECGHAPLDKIAHSFTGGEDCICGQKYTPTEGLAFELNDDGESYKVTGIGTATDTKIVIPSTYGGKPVTAIAEFAFYPNSEDDNADIVSITVPEGITSIGYGAFAFQTALKNISIPDSATTIAEDAFGECRSLVYNEYDNGLYLGNNGNPYHAFITVKDNTLPQCAINAQTKVISPKAFEKSCVTELIIPEGVVSLSTYALAYCKTIKNITLPDTLKNIGRYAFRNCPSLYSAVIPGGITAIEEPLFADCTSLVSVTVPASVTTIAADAFKQCPLAVYYCEITQEKSLNLDWDSNWNNSSPIVWDCKNNNIADNGNEYVVIDGLNYTIYNNTATLYSQPSAVTEAVIPAEITYNSTVYSVTVNAKAFSTCPNLKSVTLSKAANYKYLAMHSCTSIEHIYIDMTCEGYKSAKKNSLSMTIVSCVNYTVHCTDGDLIYGTGANS